MSRTVTYQNIEVGVYTTKEELDRFLKEFPAEDYVVDLMYFEDEFPVVKMLIFLPMNFVNLVMVKFITVTYLHPIT